MRSGHICQWRPYGLSRMLGGLVPGPRRADGMQEMPKGLLAGKAETDILRHLPCTSMSLLLPIAVSFIRQSDPADTSDSAGHITTERERQNAILAVINSPSRMPVPPLATNASTPQQGALRTNKAVRPNAQRAPFRTSRVRGHVPIADRTLLPNRARRPVRRVQWAKRPMRPKPLAHPHRRIGPTASAHLHPPCAHRVTRLAQSRAASAIGSNASMYRPTSRAAEDAEAISTGRIVLPLTPWRRQRASRGNASMPVRKDTL